MKFTSDVDVAKVKPIIATDEQPIPMVVLESVELREVEISDMKDNKPSTYEYAGKTIPNVVFTFKQLQPDGAPTRMLFVRESPVASVSNDGTPVTDLDKLILQMWNRMLHIYQACRSLPHYQDMGLVPDLKIDGSIDENLESYRKFFKFIVDKFNNGKKIGEKIAPVFFNEHGKPAPAYLKLVADFNSKKYLNIPMFVGTGFFEIINAKYPKCSLAFSAKETWKLKNAIDEDAAPKANKTATSAAAAEAEVLSPELQAILDGNK